MSRWIVSSRHLSAKLIARRPNPELQNYFNPAHSYRRTLECHKKVRVYVLKDQLIAEEEIRV